MKIKQTILFSLLALLFSVPAQSKELVVGVENLNFYPHYAPDDNNEYSGYARAVLDEFAKAKGHKLTYKMFPIPRLWDTFFKGEIDLKYPDNPYWNKGKKQSHQVSYSDSVVRFAEGVMVIPTNKGKGEASLKKLSLIRGFTPFGYVDQIKAGDITAQESNNFEGAIKMALSKRSQGVYVNVAVAEHILRGMSKTGALVFDDSLPASKDSFFLSSTKHKDVIEEFNAFLKENADTVQALKDKYKVEAGID